MNTIQGTWQRRTDRRLEQESEHSPQEKHYPSTGIILGLTAVREERRGALPLLKLYDVLDPDLIRSARGPDPIAANYTATLAVLLSHGREVAGSAAEAFLRPDNPRFATGIYLMHPYDPNNIPILFIHGLISSPILWQNLTNDLGSDPEVLEHYQPWFFSISNRPACVAERGGTARGFTGNTESI